MKRILPICLLAGPLFAAQENIDFVTPDTVFQGFTKIQNNFDELYAVLPAEVSATADQTGAEIDTLLDGFLTHTNWALDWTVDQGATNIHVANLPDLSGTYQPLDADLTTWAGVTPTANGQSLVSAANYAAMRTLLNLEAGTDFYSISAADLAFQPIGTYLSNLSEDTTPTLGGDLDWGTYGLAGGTVTANNPFSLTQTWNDGAVAFTGLEVDVTDTASAAASLLADFKVGGVSKIKVDKVGQIFLTQLGGDGSGLITGGSALSNSRSYIGQYGVRLNSSNNLSWSTGNNLNILDLYLFRDAAGILAQRNTTNAQESRLYNTWTDASNGEWLEMGFQDTANTAVIKTNANGTGTVRDIVINGVTIDSDSVITLTPTAGQGISILSGALTQTRISGGNLRLVDAGAIRWRSTNNISTGADDTMLTRNAAGVLQIGTTAANSLGSLLLTNLTANGVIYHGTTAGITASVTQTQGQGALTTDFNEVSTVANTNDTVTAPTAAAGAEITIINNGANTLQIFPASGDNLGAGVDTAVTLAAGSNVRYVAYDATNWETL